MDSFSSNLKKELFLFFFAAEFSPTVVLQPVNLNGALQQTKTGYSYDLIYIVMTWCRHGALQHYCWWNRYVANPIKKWGYVGQGRAAMRLLKNEILDKVLLRRTKVQCADVLALPPR